MDAWIDCLTYRDEDDGMASVVVLPGGMLTLQLDEGRAFAERCPEQYAALVECAALSTGVASRPAADRSSHCRFTSHCRVEARPIAPATERQKVSLVEFEKIGVMDEQLIAYDASEALPLNEPVIDFRAEDGRVLDLHNGGGRRGHRDPDAC